MLRTCYGRLLATAPLQWEGMVGYIEDSLTGGPPASPPTGTLTDGPYRETMESHGDQFLYGGGERPGTYDVELRADGYRPWRVEGVEAGHDGCHVENVELLARLVRSTGS
ncbi:MAG: hypothetical protein OXI83_13775 [Gemmatimonadota bacterium]|nr:hypothetical protein [Gemmatimonadota bacterium]